VSGRLVLRRGIVVDEEPLAVEIDGERRPAWADTALLGEMRAGDEVVVNVAARDLGLGSGGFDVVHVNLTRGLAAPRPGPRGAERGERGEGGENDEGDEGGEGGEGGEGREPHVMKLNYTSIQHPVEPAEPPLHDAWPLSHRPGAKGAKQPRVLVLPLHGHLAPAAWAARQARPELRVGYVQTGGGALPGGLSRDVAELRERELLCGHVTAAPAYGGEQEAISVAGALDAVSERLGWDAVLVGPGPGIIGSATRLGHGGIAALDSAHAALALALPTLLSPRLSAADPRERHRGVSHHTLTVMSMLLAGVEVPVPAGEAIPTAILAEACGWRHKLREEPADIAGYAASGLPARTMGRGIEEDSLFFAAALAAGTALARGD
jgi:Protein of unknown function (DUF3866)